MEGRQEGEQGKGRTKTPESLKVRKNQRAGPGQVLAVPHTKRKGFDNRCPEKAVFAQCQEAFRTPSKHPSRRKELLMQTMPLQ